jgi:hypothetical protein
MGRGLLICSRLPQSALADCTVQLIDTLPRDAVDGAALWTAVLVLAGSASTLIRAKPSPLGRCALPERRKRDTSRSGSYSENSD